MNTRIQNRTAATIPLNETFLRLVSGAAALGDILAERAAARTAQLAGADDYTRRRLRLAEIADPFGLNFCH